MSHHHGSGRHPLLTSSLEHYLHDLALKIVSDVLVFDDRYGLLPVRLTSEKDERDVEDTSTTGMSERHHAKVLQPGVEAFKNRDYANCVAHLSRFEGQPEKRPAALPPCLSIDICSNKI